MEHRKIVELAAAIILALIPAVILYLLFQGENVAEYVKESEGIKLGGPAALFVIILLIELRYLSRKTVDKLANLKKELAGTWGVTAVSADQHNAVSNCDITVEDNELAISGGQFMEGDNPLGSWSVDCLFLSKNKLVYLYRLKETGGTGKYWKGLVDLNISQHDGKTNMAGSWEVIGPEYRSGTITYAKQ